jgi:WD40 repeat protein
MYSSYCTCTFTTLKMRSSYSTSTLTIRYLIVHVNSHYSQYIHQIAHIDSHYSEYIYQICRYRLTIETVLDFETGVSRKVGIHPFGVWCVDSNESVIVSGGADGFVKVWQLSDFSLKSSLRHKHPIYDVAISPINPDHGIHRCSFYFIQVLSFNHWKLKVCSVIFLSSLKCWYPIVHMNVFSDLKFVEVLLTFN